MRISRKWVLQYYNKLFTTSNPNAMEEVTANFPRVITDEMNEALEREVSEEEVRRALKQMKPTKAPGPDCFAPCFYQRFWSIVGRDVVHAVRTFLHNDEYIRQINCTHVTLIPKVKTLKTMTRLFFFSGDEECRVVKELLLSYERVSGQQVNFQKSRVSFSQNVHIDKQLEQSKQLQVKRVTKHDKYHSLPTEISYSKEEAFSYVKEKIDKSMKGWRDNL
ncbi:hypothetical protein ACLB2K_006855 [Fragaria x ananassa]